MFQLYYQNTIIIQSDYLFNEKPLKGTTKSGKLEDHINPQEECSKVFQYLLIFQYFFPLKDQKDPVLTENDINSIMLLFI